MKVRTEKILHKLLFSNQMITIQDLANQYNVGLRTIQGDVSEINELLTRHSLQLIKNTRDEGLLLELSDEDIELVSELLKNSNNYEIYFEKNMRQFHLILELTVGDSFFIYEKEEDFGVSKSALDSDMREIRKLMKKYDLVLKSDLKNGLKLFGAERNIRTMLFDQIFKTLSVEDIFVETNHFLSEYQMFFEFISLEMLKELNIVYDEFYKNSNYLYKDQLLIILGIWILRNNQLSNSEHELIETDHKIIKPFIKKVNQKFNLSPNKDEIEYINSIMDTLTEDVDINPSDWLEIQLFTINLIHELNTTLNISFENQPDNVFKKLFEHNIRLHARFKKNIQLYNPLTKDIKEDYEDIFTIVKSFFESYFKPQKYDIKDDEIAFIVIHLLAVQSYQKQDEERQFRAVVFCNYGLATSALLAENLQKYFPVEIVANLNINELYLLDKIDYDLIFSTRTLSLEKDSYLLISPILDDRNIQRIERYLETNKKYKRIHSNLQLQETRETKEMLSDIVELIEDEYGIVDYDFLEKMINIFKKNKINLDIKEIQPMIKDILSDDNIQLNIKPDSWKEAIEESAQPLLDKKVIEDKYVHAMINSVKEFGPYIVFGNGLALAHARPEDGVNELGLSVATLNTPIDFGNEGNDYAEVVFCLAAVDSYSHLNIIKSLVGLLDEEDKLNQLKKSKDIEEFKKILF